MLFDLSQTIEVFVAAILFFSIDPTTPHKTRINRISVVNNLTRMNPLAVFEAFSCQKG